MMLEGQSTHGAPAHLNELRPAPRFGTGRVKLTAPADHRYTLTADAYGALSKKMQFQTKPSLTFRF